MKVRSFIMKMRNEIHSIICTDKIVLNYPSLRTEDNKVNLHYYHPKCIKEENGSSYNIGDYLSQVVVGYMCDYYNIDINKKILGKSHLYAIGSILLMGYQNAAIWGSGFPFEPNCVRGIPHSSFFRNLDIRCVRGPYTRRSLEKLGHKGPKVYGDPAILMPFIYQPDSCKSDKTLIIPHYSKFKETQERYGKENTLRMNTCDYEYVINQICSSKLVISSSLHGIIVAEAYGIPAIYYQDRHDRFNYKYKDWYESTGRELRSINYSVEEAKKSYFPTLKPEKRKAMQEQLIETFPIDLWMK